MDPVNGRNRATITYGLSGRHPSYLDVAGLDGFRIGLLDSGRRQVSR
jgi:hypothetical protein